MANILCFDPELVSALCKIPDMVFDDGIVQSLLCSKRIHVKDLNMLNDDVRTKFKENLDSMDFACFNGDNLFFVTERPKQSGLGYQEALANNILSAINS